jgi:hypothetical protein
MEKLLNPLPAISMINTNWFQAALNSSTHGYASVEIGWNNVGDLLYLRVCDGHDP